MDVTVVAVLVIVAFALTIVSAIGKCPLWIPVLLLTLIHMLALFPVGHA